MILQDQITPVYKRSDGTSTETNMIGTEEVEEEENEEIEENEEAKVERVLQVLSDKKSRLIAGRRYNSEQLS